MQAQAIIDTIFTKLPVVFLGIALLLMFFEKVPSEDHDMMIAIISGLLGIVTGRSTAPNPSTTTSTTLATGANPEIKQ